MKKAMLSEIFSKRNVNRVIALMLTLLMLTFAGCKSNEPAGSTGNSSNQPSQDDSSQVLDNSSTNSDASSSEDDASSSEDDASTPDDTTSTPSTQSGSSSVKVDPLKGEISADYTTVNNKRTDDGEVKPVADPLTNNPAFPYTGYAQKERNALLKKILNTPNTLELYKVKGNVYYVSPGGDDKNDGTSPEKAIQSLPAINGLPLQPGDAVLLERGSIFRLQDEALSLRAGITYGSYGKGSKPMIYGSAKNFAQSVWKPSKKKNVWQVSYMNATPAGAFFDDGKEVGFMKISLRALSKNTDFYFDSENSILYLYCDKGNPSKVWKSIELSQTDVHLDFGTHLQNLTIDNLSLRYMGTFGLSADYNNHYITVTNCEFGFIGGAFTGQYRYGNAVQAWCGGHDLKWDNNWVYQTFDTGMSPQGAAGHDVSDYYNISMSGNLFEYNNGDIEIWEAGAGMLGQNISLFYNWKMNNNISRFNSLGWGTRKEEGTRGIQGVQVGQTRENQIVKNFTWNNNIIDCPGDFIYNKTTHSQSGFDLFERKGNTYYIKQSLRRHEVVATKFVWENGVRKDISANNKEQWINAIKSFEPTATVYWYK